MEMAFVRLCEPKLDTSTDALNSRLSAVERAVKNGVQASAMPARTAKPAEVKDNVSIAEKAEPAKNDFNPPVEDSAVQTKSAEEDLVSNEPPVQQTAPEIQPPQAEPTSAQMNTEQQPFTQWADLMEIIHRTDIPLFSVLAGSKGYTRGEFFLIDSPNTTIKEFIKISTHSKAIKQALFELTGNHYKLGLFKKKAEENHVKRDPLEDLLSKARGNIEINEQ